MDIDIIKVAAKSRTTGVAGAIAAVIRQVRYAEVQAIGASAVNQAVKAVAIARTYLADDDIDVICIPQFTQVEIDGVPYYSAVLFRKALFPQRTGKLPIGAIEPTVRTIDFFRRTAVPLRIEALEIEVLPLPEQGRPAGLLGGFRTEPGHRFDPPDPHRGAGRGRGALSVVLRDG